MVLAALAMMLAGATIFKSVDSPAAMGAGLGVIYLVFAVIYIFPALRLWKYASSIAALLATGSVANLEDALNQQRSFWKFIGILMLTVLVIYLLFFIGLLVVGGFAAMKLSGN